MANFCTNCGSPLGAGPFCVKCGADMRAAGSSAPPSGPQAAAAQSAQLQPPVQAVAPAAAKSGTSVWLKLAIAVIVLFFAGGLLVAGGIYYAAHRINQKIHQVADGLTGGMPDSTSPASGASVENPACNLLSKEDVGRAIGVAIIRAQPSDNGCSYIAKGDQAEMTARHTTALATAHGADKQQQQIIQAFAGGMFKTFQSERREAPAGTPGEVPVFQFSIDENSAGTQMLLNSKTLGVLGPAGAQNISGIGDEAFVSGDSMLMFRKDNKLVRIMYMTCPCNTEAVKPLAKKLAEKL